MTLARRIEEASLNAWPAMQQLFLDGWILRFAKGFTKRANSIVPLYPGATEPSVLADKIRYCENLYARERLQTVFRLPSMCAEPLDELLAQRGYQHAETSLVLSSARLDHPSHPDVRLLTLEDWLQQYGQLTGITEPAVSLHKLLLKAISGDCAFAVIYAANEPVACGLAVIEQELVGLFDIFTNPSHRRSGYGRHLVTTLMAWGRREGAQRAYLQVIADNAAAAALYRDLGFSEVYRYWYRLAP